MSAAASWCWNAFKGYPAQNRTAPRTKGETLQIPETLPYQEHASSYAVLENFRLDSSAISQEQVREIHAVLLRNLLFCLKTTTKKISLRSSIHIVWKCNLARKNNNTQAIRQAGAKHSLAKLLEFAAADFAENSISPEQAAARAMWGQPRFSYKCRFLSEPQHQKHINSFLFLLRLWLVGKNGTGRRSEQKTEKYPNLWRWDKETFVYAKNSYGPPKLGMEFEIWISAFQKYHSC